MLILLACFATFFVYSMVKFRKLNLLFSVDVVLLFICLLGPIAVDSFSILSLVSGPLSTKKVGWSISLLYAATDFTASIVQVPEYDDKKKTFCQNLNQKNDSEWDSNSGHSPIPLRNKRIKSIDK